MHTQSHDEFDAKLMFHWERRKCEEAARIEAYNERNAVTYATPTAAALIKRRILLHGVGLPSERVGAIY